ncbi:hypothetical protein BRSU_2796 [Brachyspira suanatina]|uniref:Lipopolysaccharide biosynthesis protein n=1 Tax=Brachyspira suanatina TaxID=381802 RepID=A0A0G4KAW3_9SPIR|nr:rhamnan synthesis F family protein [Brachyspira suanatina]CRF35672.1 hypothetical protein BRSU_2796 [Brachyspira suanatina]
MNTIRRIVIFAGYDKDNIIDDYVVYYIKELKKVADIVYVSDCNMLESELDKISSYCIHIINGRHGEYDFGSYKRGYIYAEEQNILKDYDYLMLINDSVFGPFFDLKTIVENMENKNSDVWGMFKYLENNTEKEHLQSYFVSMKNKVFISKEYNSFIHSVKKETDKGEIIRKYEIGQSVLFKKCSYSIESFLDSSSKSDCNIENNVLLFDPLPLIEKGFPFLKIFMFKNLLELKKHHVINMDITRLYRIIDIIKKDYEIKLIIDYLNSNNIMFPKFRKLKNYFLNKKFLYIELSYYNLEKCTLLIKLFNFIRITIFIPNKYIFYKNFDFILKT